MCHCFALAALGLLGPVAAAGGAKPPQEDVAKELKRYYADNKPPPFEAAIQKLAMSATPEREGAALYLRTLLAQLLHDEKSGAAPWRATPIWGSSGENPARNLRQSIAEQLAASKPLPGAVPVLRWFFDDEFLPAPQDAAAKALARLTGEDAARLRVELVSRPHGNLVVAVAALKQIAAANDKLPAETLRVLSHHHRPSLREAARQLNKQQGEQDPGPFDAAKAMETLAVAKVMRDIGALLIEPLPPGAPLPAAFVNFEAEAVRVERIRKGGDEHFHFSNRGGLTGQFEARGASLYEAVMAHRLHRAGKLDLAGRVLFPMLENLYRDNDLVAIVRHELGRYHGYQMLVAFAGDRDYDRAVKIAEMLMEHFPETLFHELAVRMAAELPKRRDDFAKLKLPRPADWARMKRKLTRGEQIDFLCKHMRLLNVSPYGEQSALATGALRSDATWPPTSGVKGAVINPLEELTGPLNWFGAQEDRPGIHLTLRDVPQLSKYLREDWLMLCVHYWREFHPARTIPTTRSQFVMIINDLAKEKICNLNGWDKLSAAEIDAEIDRINRWAMENAPEALPEERRDVPGAESWEVLEHVTFGLAYSAYLLLCLQALLHMRGQSSRWLSSLTITTAIAHVALVWHSSFSWSLSYAWSEGPAAFLIFHTALSLIIAAAHASPPWNARSTWLAWAIVTVGAMGAVLRREVVEHYMWPVAIAGGVTLVGYGLLWRSSRPLRT